MCPLDSFIGILHFRQVTPTKVYSSQSRIPFNASLPAFYEITVTAVHGGATARRTTVIEVQ